jgi:leucyl-tRNA synthetase
MLRITAYADRLIGDLDRLDWPEPIKLMQRNWIGRSEGARIDFPVVGTDASIEVFTTRPDTLFGATYMVLAPSTRWSTGSPLPVAGRRPAGELDRGSGDAGRRDRRLPPPGQAKSDAERQADARDKTGVFTGAYARNPANGEQIPVFVADYVLMGYGTARSWRCPARTSATGSSPRSSSCRSCGPYGRRRTSPARRTSARDPRSTPPAPRSTSTGSTSRRPRRGSPSGWSAPAPAPAR